MCEMYNCPVTYTVEEDRLAWNSEEMVQEDRVILETEITLKTGPNITMKIHEESRCNSELSGTFTESEEDSKRRAIIKVLNDDSETEGYEESRTSPRTPRKVRFGGESVKLRTPESDSSHQAEEEDNQSILTITVTDAVSITTRKSLIPVRISSLPSSPKKSTLPDPKPLKKQYQSAPNLSALSSKIPIRKHALQEKKKVALETGETSGINHTSSKAAEKPASLKPPILKHSRAEDVLSPVPVHNEIEVFHNLTRSPERSRKSSLTGENKEEPSELEKEREEPAAQAKTYDSFQVYKEVPLLKVPKESSVVIEEITESNALKVHNGKPSALQQSLSSLTSEDEVWAKSEALDSVVKMLKEPGTCESLEAGAAALLFEALFACHHRDRLHSLADDSLMILIAGLRPEVLERCLPRLILSLCKMGASSGVRCALVAMKKLPPKKLQLEVLSRGFGHRTREGALQILMACTRLYPRQDVEVVRIAEFAALALRDRRRRVRQAALETLAAAAQLSSVHETLNVVESAIKDFGDFGEIIQVVRTRLSRKQLPTVDLDGSIRYTSPIDQNESHWITGSVLKGNVSPSPISSASSSNTSANYWMHNLRHEHNFNSGSMRIRQLSESNEEDVFDDSCKIWTPDASNCDTLKAANGSKAGVLRPVYILQPESATENGKHSRGYRKYDRGRSFSPPKHFKGHFPAGLVDPVPIIPVHSNTNGTDKHYSAPDAYSRLQYPADSRLQQGFRKSFSSDQLYSNDRLPSKYEPQSLSLSSRSSSTSTGSSTKSGFWYRDLKSGIPLPIAESKLKIRHSTSSSITSNGPLIAKRSITNSPQHTPGSSKPSPRPQTHVGDHESISHLSLPPPLSSGSETSGYYTPSPPDTYPPAFIKMDTEERPSSDAEEPIEQNRADSRSNKSVLNEEGQSPGPGSRIGSAQPTNHFLGEPIHDNYPSVESIQLNNNEEVAQSRPPSHQLLLQSIPAKIEIRRKSKSVIDLPNFLPQIAPIRKNVNSAPPRNEDNVLNNNPEPDATDPLPPMVDAGQHQEVTKSQQSSAVVRKSKLERRRLSRNDSKTLKASPRAAAESSIAKPPNKPKDVLQHVLTQLEDPNWEATVEGLQGLIKLLKQSPDTVLQQIHQICIVLAKHIKNLRSQVARVACNTASELFLTCRRALDMEIEDIAIPLLQRTADTNRFLRADANATLDVMCEHLPTHRVIPVVAARGCAHPNSVVRAASVRLLGDLVRRLGAERVFCMPKELRDKLLLAGANALADGNVEARSHGKSMLKHLVEHPNFQRNLREAVPQNILRHISKVLATIKPDA
ncbi:uncharacterized protein LOC109538479 [Dendroctonus ponderosae]|uniref:uncharacterized protein LOC109538479 n=1 Tax=Dendroctonus ponderosae TaxID=77166 RepID=UPI0020363224|nr:uncharacterized protein LOC109538479 [Dendroctonus ponderosae]